MPNSPHPRRIPTSGSWRATIALQLPHPHERAGVWGLQNVDERITWIAERQRGAVGREQLFAVAISHDEIRYRLRHGRLHHLYRGVYLVGHSTPAPLAREIGALLACGHEAVLSHRTAAGVYGLTNLPGEPHVTVTRDLRRKGIRIHRTSTLSRRVVQGLPITPPSRTIIDLAEAEPLEVVERAIAEAERRRLVRRDELTAPKGRHGARILKAILDDGPTLTRSEAERKLLAVIRDADLPRPETNQRLGDFEVDALWRDQRLVVEVDGFQFHGDRQAFEQDRTRDQRLTAGGWRVVRVTWRQLQNERLAVAARLAQALAQ